jgi:hypothetical protein
MHPNALIQKKNRLQPVSARCATLQANRYFFATFCDLPLPDPRIGLEAFPLTIGRALLRCGSVRRASERGSRRRRPTAMMPQEFPTLPH